MYEFSGLFSWVRNLIFANGIMDEVGMTAEEKRNAFIEYLFDTLTDIFFSFFEQMSSAFSAFGSRAINYFSFSFTSNFFITIVGIIFGFFVFKFILGKVIDLISNIIDLT